MLRDWLGEHGYGDLYPRRDATDLDANFYVFVKEGRPRLVVRCRRSSVERRRRVAADERR